MIQVSPNPLTLIQAAANGAAANGAAAKHGAAAANGQAGAAANGQAAAAANPAGNGLAGILEGLTGANLGNLGLRDVQALEARKGKKKHGGKKGAGAAGAGAGAAGAGAAGAVAATNGTAVAASSAASSSTAAAAGTGGDVCIYGTTKQKTTFVANSSSRPSLTRLQVMALRASPPP